MSSKILSSRHVAVLALAFASGCSSQEPAEKTRTVTGAVTAASLTGLVVPSVVVQSSTGQTFDGPVAPDGTFAVKVPSNITARLFLTDLRASGRSSVESVVLWPGRLVWAAVPAGSTSDGPAPPISVGNIQPVGGTADGTFSQLTNPGGGLVNGGAPGANPPSGSLSATSGGTSGTSGGAGGSGDGESGGGGGSDGTSNSGGTSSGGGGTGTSDGPTLCVPPAPTMSECDGSGDGITVASASPAPLPPCTKSSGTGGGGSSGGTASSTPPAAPPGAPTCEKDKVAQQRPDGRWDCVKMETPVTYFYSDKPMKVRASVEFPRGVLTQWYPSVVEQYPLAAEMKELVSTSSSKAKVCSADKGSYGAPSAENGLLDWGTLDLLGRDANVDASLPPASLDRYTWSFARQVAANPLKASSGQLEKFLFYRGVGNFSLPVRIQSAPGGKLALKNLIDDKIGSVFFLNVTADKGTFTSAEGGIARGATLPGTIPSMDNARDVDAYADDLARSVRTSLDAQGLYDDESTAMVNTWKKQWFRTPGPRLLYIAPQSWTDASIPLSIDPKPESTKRVMVIRVEILTPEMEAADVAALEGLATPTTAAATRSHFAALGRFAEPRLRRAIVLAGHPAYAEPLLAETVATNHTTHKPTAGTSPLAPQANGPKYGGKGFVVHEWGTDTIVVGSDGSQLLGLQHEEEDLPGFVYDRTH
jgi:hypothetical protein